MTDAPGVPPGTLPPGGTGTGGTAPAAEPAAAHPAAIGRTMADVAGRSQRLVQDWLNRQARTAAHGGPAPDLLAGGAFLEMTARLMQNPARMMQAGLGFWQDYLTLWQSSARRMWGLDAAPAAAAPASPGDARFTDAAWDSNEVFAFIKQSYLLTARFIHGVVAGAEGLDPRTAQRVDAYARQFIDAMSPANFLLTNPEVLRQTARTGGENLLRGLSNLLGDLEHGRGRLLPGPDGAAPCAPGRDVAVTPGKVVFQNGVMQLVQYAPAGPRVLRRPLLVVPPWTAKFYALDLRPRHSFVRWAVAQGHTLFMLSWANPDPAADWGFEDALRDGVLAALDAIGQATGEADVNAVGYGLGGTLLAAAAAALAGTGDRRLRSLTLLAATLDFAEAGDPGAVMDEEALGALNAADAWDGADRDRGAATSLLRANDLIWSFVVNTYLLGREPLPFDLLHWNRDRVRVPPSLQTFTLHKLHGENLLRQPGGLTLLGQPVNLRTVAAPAYVLSAREDRIAPWASACRGAALLGGARRFVLAGGGHVSGVVNPPEGGKGSHWTGAALADAPGDWLAGATRMAGSWWPDWQRWVAALDSATVPARVPGTEGLPALEDAPGSYVRVRAG